jgi:dihydroneopterin aldolase
MEEERVIGGDYRVDVVLDCDLDAAGQSDDLTETVDYCLVHRVAAREMAVQSRLIEHVGRRIVKGLRAEIDNTPGLPEVASIEVTVTKFSPPVDGDVASVAVVIRG